MTVKTRIGIDDRDSYEELTDFVGQVAEAGCDALIVHARKAWLQGLSPRENREIPPLRYDVVAAAQGRLSGLGHRHQRRHPDPGRGGGASSTAWTAS